MSVILNSLIGKCSQLGDKPEEFGILLEITLRLDVFSDLTVMPLRCAGLFLVCSKATLTKQKRWCNLFLF